MSSNSNIQTVLGQVTNTSKTSSCTSTYQLAVLGDENPIGSGPSPCPGCFGIFNKSFGTQSFVITPTSNIGIGTYIPTQKLDVDGTIQSTGLQVNGEGQGFFIVNINKANSWGGISFKDNGLPKWGIQKTTSNDMLFTKLDGTGTPFTILWNGNIGIGTLATAYPLQMGGGAYCSGTQWIKASDRRLKKEIIPSSYGLKEVMQLKPQFYVYTSDITQKRDMGFIAQEVQKIIPEIVSGKEGDISKGETLGISYGNLTAVLVSAIQEQQKEIANYKQEVAAYKSQTTALAEEVQSLKKLIQKKLK